MLRFAALFATIMLLVPSVAAAQGAEPVGTVSDDETSVSRAYDGDPSASILGLFTIGLIADTDSEAMGMMATMPPVFASSLASAGEDAGFTAGAPEPLTVAPLGDETTGLRVPYTMFGSLEGEIVVIGVRQGTWVQMLIGMGVGENGVQAQLEDLARQLLPRWPSADPVTVRPDGLRTGGIWAMMPLPEDVPAGFEVDPDIEEGPAAGTVSEVPGGTGTTSTPAPSPSLDLPLLPTPTPAGGETPQVPAETPPVGVTPPAAVTPAATAPAEVATPAPNPRVALPFDVTVEIFLPLDMATMNDDGSCSGTGFLDGLSGDGQVTLQGATGDDVSASAPMSGAGQVALDRETGEEICYFRSTLTDVPPRARYALLAGETVLGQYTYAALTETGSILVVIGED